MKLGFRVGVRVRVKARVKVRIRDRVRVIRISLTLEDHGSVKRTVQVLLVSWISVFWGWF